MDKQFPVSISSLYEILAFIREQSLEAGFEEKWLHKIELASEEALVNVFKYSKLTENDSITISCKSPGAPGIEISMIDKGIPYNPLLSYSSEKALIKDSVETKKLGGYGVYLIYTLMDHVSYVYEDNANKLTIVKYIC